MSAIHDWTDAELAQVSATTIEHYERLAHEFWEGTRTHDVSQISDVPQLPGRERA